MMGHSVHALPSWSMLLRAPMGRSGHDAHNSVSRQFAHTQPSLRLSGTNVRDLTENFGTSHVAGGA